MGRGRAVTPSCSWTMPPGIPAGLSGVPENPTPLPLPPGSPELNPVERIWKYLRSHKISNRTFKNYIEVLDICVDAWNYFVADPALITCLCHVDWAESAN